MIDLAVLREDDRQSLHAQLSGREGRTRVSTGMEKSMGAPGTWPDHVKTFNKKGVCSEPSKRKVQKNPGQMQTLFALMLRIKPAIRSRSRIKPR
jgi:hypothetical protein